MSNLVIRKFILLLHFFIFILAQNNSIAQYTKNQDLENLLIQHQWIALIKHVEEKNISKKYINNKDQSTYYSTLLAEAYYKKGDIFTSKKLIKPLLEITSELQDSSLICRIYLVQVQILNIEGHLSELHYYLDPVYKYAQKHQDDMLLHDCYITLGGQAMQNSDNQHALQMFKMAKSISLKNKYAHFYQKDDVNLALAHCFLLQLDSAKVHLENAIRSATQQKDSAFLATAHNVLGFYYLLKKKQKAWKKQIMLSLSIGEKIQNPLIIALAFNQLLENSVSENKFEEAILLGEKAHKAIPYENAPLFHAHVDSLMYEAFKGKGDTPSALLYFEKYYRGRTSILSKGQAEKLEDVKRNFELQGKNLLIQNQALELANSKKRSILLIVSNGFLLLLLIGGYLFVRNRKILQTTLYKKEKMTGLLFKQEKLLVGASEETQIENRFNALENDLGSKSHESLYDTKDKRDLYLNMIQAIEEQKLYLNPNLDINMIVTTLGTNKFYLYQAISNHASENFRNIINRYRVEEVKRLLEKFVDERSVHNIESIHTEAGFNSPSSYYRIFKNMTGLTPKEYIQEYSKDLNKI